LERLELPGWRIAYDARATIATYARISYGDAETCPCDGCWNWVRIRAAVMPPELVALLENLGIPPDREAEVSHFGSPEPGKHFYAGWYHFVGAVEYGEQEASPFVEFGSFRVFPHSSPVLLRDAFRGMPVVQLEFEAEVPWLSEILESY
jgi:hypothetical protein